MKSDYLEQNASLKLKSERSIEHILRKQKGRIKPARFTHCISIPVELYKEVAANGFLQTEYYFIEDTIFVILKGNMVELWFPYLYLINDIHIRLMSYLLIKATGSDPIKRKGEMF